MVALNPFTAKGVSFNIPAEFPTQGRGSGRANAWVRGVRAASRGKGEDSCPYAQGRGSGSWRRAWLKGHDAYYAAQNWRNK